MSSITSQQNALIGDKSTICNETYDDFKKNPEGFRSIFQRRLSFNDISI